ncbi:hypothetical protein PNQ69_20700 [Xanthomonas sp. A2111]|uniref:Uncharacterized protein n=1 Tax=Xanthomonas hawaiiensis TaxID=3003247 RepID=A0ABU2IAL6_9XANT|nr:hypothetical protein [Xanthomonas sp. A2111]MDS9995185.1 hypothetical protein [Xanthomonas sp. A2111]
MPSFFGVAGADHSNVVISPQDEIPDCNRSAHLEIIQVDSQLFSVNITLECKYVLDFSICLLDLPGFSIKFKNGEKGKMGQIRLDKNWKGMFYGPPARG